MRGEVKEREISKRKRELTKERERGGGVKQS